MKVLDWLMITNYVLSAEDGCIALLALILQVAGAISQERQGPRFSESRMSRTRRCKLVAERS